MKTNTLVLQHSGSYEDGCWWKMAGSVAATIHKAAALVLAVFADLSLFYASGLAATHSVVGHLGRLWVSAALRALALTAVTLFTLGDLRPWLIRFIAAYTLLPAVFETGTKALYHEESQCSQMAGVRCWLMCAGASLAAALFWEITVPDTDEEAADKKSKQKARVLFVRVLLLFKPDYLLLLGGLVFLSLAVLCVHTWQMMVGCEWDDETGEVNGYWQYGYDGEDFILFDLKTETWIAPTSQAVITKHKWDNDKALIAQTKNYLTQICPEWLKKYVDYGRSSLMRTVSLLQKTPSSPVSCHATGFYPVIVDMFWRKDGEELHEDVDHGEILPSNDGTFQMSVDLKLSSVKPEDWSRYDCVFQLSGFNEDIVTGLEKPEIRTNWGETEIRDGGEFPTAAVIGAVVGLFVLLGLYIIGVIFWRRRHNTGLLPTAAIRAVVGLSVLLFIPLFILLVLYIIGVIVWRQDHNNNIGFIPTIKHC